jgi:hypothetical protein
MLIRVLCIGLLFVIPFPWNLLPILFAVFSPWFAVLLANNAQVEQPELVKPTLSLEDKG